MKNDSFFLVLGLRGNASLRRKTAFIISSVSHKQDFLIKASKLAEMRKASVYSIKHFNKYAKKFSNYEHIVCILESTSFHALNILSCEAILSILCARRFKN